MRTREFEYIKTYNVMAPVTNDRIHSDEHINKICDSIRVFGWISPIIIDGDNDILAGYARVLAARKMGIRTVPCVVIRGLTQQQKVAFRVADNALVNNSFD